MYNRITQEVEQKRETVKVAGGGEVLNGEDVSVYALKLDIRKQVLCIL